MATEEQLSSLSKRFPEYFRVHGSVLSQNSCTTPEQRVRCRYGLRRTFTCLAIICNQTLRHKWPKLALHCPKNAWPAFAKEQYHDNGAVIEAEVFHWSFHNCSGYLFIFLLYREKIKTASQKSNNHCKFHTNHLDFIQFTKARLSRNQISLKIRAIRCLHLIVLTHTI